MAGITLEQAETQLALWLEADTALSKGQSYSVGGRSVSRAETQVKIEYWDRRVKELTIAGGSTAGGRRVRSGVLIP